MKQITLLMTLLAFTFGFSQAQKTDYADFKEGFGDVVYTPQSFEHPSGAQAWGGFANMNTSMYPLSFENACLLNEEIDIAVHSLKDVPTILAKKRERLINQSLDLAQLSQGLLKGEALTNFIKRSYEMIK